MLHVHKVFSRLLSSPSFKRCMSRLVLTDSYVHATSTAALTGSTIGQVLDETSFNHASTDAVVSCHQHIRRNWSEVKQEADQLARAFLTLGVQHGDRIGIWGTNSYEWQLTQFAAAKIGAILVNVNQAYQRVELEYCLNQVGISLLVAAEGYRTSDYYSMLESLLPALNTGQLNSADDLRSQRVPLLRHVVMISADKRRGVVRFWDVFDAAGGVSSTELESRQQRVECDHPCSIQFTSGTTGLPKGATLSHHNVLNNARLASSRCGYDVAGGGLRMCVPVPLYHCFGCVLGSLVALLHGNTLVFPSPTFSALQAVKAVQEERCSTLYGTPTMFVDIVNLPGLDEYDLSSLTGGLTAGAPTPFPLMEAMVQRLGMRNAVVGYGLTETSPLLTLGWSSDDMQHRCGTVGSAMAHTELKVVDAEGRVVPVGTPGQLCSRGYSTFLGYWAQPQKTSESIMADRWLLTGDIGVMQSDGYVRIVGRAKDLVVRGGENIYPAEVESFLMKHPHVAEAYVFGVDDKRMGEELCVWIRSKDGKKLTEHDIIDFCRDEVAHFKIPRYIQFRDDFPKTVTGKVQKYKMRETMDRELRAGD